MTGGCAINCELSIRTETQRHCTSRVDTERNLLPGDSKSKRAGGIEPDWQESTLANGNWDRSTGDGEDLDGLGRSRRYANLC